MGLRAGGALWEASLWLVSCVVLVDPVGQGSLCYVGDRGKGAGEQNAGGTLWPASLGSATPHQLSLTSFSSLKASCGPQVSGHTLSFFTGLTRPRGLLGLSGWEDSGSHGEEARGLSLAPWELGLARSGKNRSCWASGRGSDFPHVHPCASCSHTVDLWVCRDPPHPFGEAHDGQERWQHSEVSGSMWGCLLLSPSSCWLLWGWEQGGRGDCQEGM